MEFVKNFIGGGRKIFFFNGQREPLLSTVFRLKIQPAEAAARQERREGVLSII